MDGLEKKLAGKAALVRMDVWGDPGRTLASKFGVRAVPTFLVFDGRGNLVYYHVGIPEQKAIIEAVENSERRE